MKLQNIILIVLGLIPYSLILSVGSLYYYAKKNSVRFPAGLYNPNSKDFDFYQSYDSYISDSFVLTVLCGLVWLLMIYAKIHNFVIHQEKTYNVYIVGLGFFGYFTAFFIMRSPILEWYFD